MGFSVSAGLHLQNGSGRVSGGAGRRAPLPAAQQARSAEGQVPGIERRGPGARAADPGVSGNGHEQHPEPIPGGLDPARAKLTLLRSTPLFRALDPSDLQRIADRSAWREYRRRQSIHLPGDPADALYVVGEGRVKLSRLSAEGREATLHLVERGELFGEEGLLEAALRDTVAEVLEPTRLLRCPREELLPFLSTRPSVALAVARLMSGRRRAAEGRVEELVFKTVRARLAALLARLARRHGRTTGGGILLDLSLAHQDLAGQIGSTRETTTLTLNEFRRGGLLHIDHCRILIRNLAGLEAMA
jgi:CRP/FNR family transcriptional regulator